MDLDDFFLDDIYAGFDKPSYLKKETKDFQHRKSMALLHGEKTILADLNPGPVWRLQPREEDPEAIKQRKVSLDMKHGTIYAALQDEDSELDIQSEPIPVLNPDQTETGLNDEVWMKLDVSIFREKSYIRSSSVHKDENKVDYKHFHKLLIKDYKKPISDKKAASYCAPYDPLPQLIRHKHDTTDDAVDSVVKPAKQQKVNTLRRKRKPRRCRKSEVLTCQYCDVLGPQTCKMCIEKTNKHIAKDIESYTLPSVDGSMLNLVAPKLSSVMRMGHRPKRQEGQQGRMTKLSMPVDNVGNRPSESQGGKRTSFAFPPILLHKSNSMNLA